jgi:hypothetical protein
MPRAALLSIHARVARTAPTALDDPSLIQLWGPRYSVFVVAAVDLPLFSLGVLPDDAKGRRKADETADRLEAFLDGRRMGYGDVGDALGVNANSLRYGAPTGRIAIRWEGARQPIVWTLPAPTMDPTEARLELARRHLTIFGPTTSDAFARWSGIAPRSAAVAFEALSPSLVPVRTPIGDAWMLARDEPSMREPARPPAPARLLPSGDAFYLVHGTERELLVADARRRASLWTSRVWPGAVLVDGEIAGTWRRANEKVSIDPWRRLTRTQRDAVVAEAESLPLDLPRAIVVRWGE